MNNAPTQVIANKDGKRCFVIVAGDVCPKKGRISYKMKKEFTEFCLSQNVIPMFAPIGIMSIDPKRAENRLALKHDGYYFDFEGVEMLSEADDS